jgi:ABC-2 type transport system ATP-binding protein
MGDAVGQTINGPAIVAEGLSKAFSDVWAVRDFTLTVGHGEVIALLGPNGAGKTTTVRMLASIIKPTGGRATVAGFDVVTQAVQVRGAVGLLTEFPGLYKRMLALEYLDFFGRLQGIEARRLAGRIEELLQRFELWDTRRIQLGHYSKGMAQKLALVRALLHDPPVLFLDEPTSAMDPHSARLVRDTIGWLQEQRRCIVICTHNLTEAQELADRIAVVRQGEIVALGTLDELRARYLHGVLCEVRLAEPWDGLLPALSPLARVEGHGLTWLRYRTDDVRRTNPQVLAALASAGVAVLTLSAVESSLEQVYLSLVEGEAGHAPAERAA